MSSKRIDLSPPGPHAGFVQVHSGCDGIWWERADGLRVRLAAPEREPKVERARLSLLGLLLAYLASEAPPR